MQFSFLQNEDTLSDLLVLLGVHSRWLVQQQRNHSYQDGCSLVLGTESCSEVDDLTWLGMVDR